MYVQKCHICFRGRSEVYLAILLATMGSGQPIPEPIYSSSESKKRTIFLLFDIETISLFPRGRSLQNKSRQTAELQ